MNRIFSFLGNFPIKIQFLLGFAPLLGVIVLVLVWSNRNLEDAFDQVTLLDDTAQETELLSDISLQLLELQRTVLVYSYIGYAGVLRKVEKLEADLDERFQQLNFEDEAMADRLARLLEHYRSYKVIFKDIVEQKRRLKTLKREVMPQHLQTILVSIAGMKEHFAGNSERLVQLLQLERDILEVNTNMKAYFLAPDSSPMMNSRRLLDAAKVVLSDEEAWADVPDLTKQILQELVVYKKDMNSVINLYRGYLYSVNVVLAGKSNEMALLGSELRTLNAEETVGLRDTISTKIGTVSSNNKTLVISVIVLSVAMSFVLAHGLASPLQSVSQALLGLARKEEHIEIPETGRRDEVGDLATAAKAFKEIVDELSAQTEMVRLQKNELQLIFDHVPARIWHKDDKNNILRLNEAAALSMGGTVADFEGKSAFDLFPEMAQKYYQDDLAVINSGESSLGIVEKYMPAGQPEGWVRTDKVLYCDSQSGEKSLLVVAQDITDLKLAEEALRESEERYDLAVQGSSVGLWDWNVLTGDLYWSPRFREILGVAEEDFRSALEEFTERLHRDDEESVLGALYQHVEDGTEYNVEYRLRHQEGHYVWIHARGQALWDEEGKAYRMAGSVADISAKQKLQLEREKLLEDVTDSNERLQHFAYVCSHDLQEPLRMISSFSEMLQEHLHEYLSNDEEAQQYFDFVMDGAVRSQELIRDILEYSRLDNSNSQLEEVSLDEILSMVQSNMKDMIDRTGGSILHGALPMVHANKTQLYQLVLNLVNNGFKYRHAGIAPQVDVLCQDAGDMWEFAIRDNGIGIKEAYYKKIFDIFERLHSNKEYPGTGLGLAICKKIVERHKGRIWLESQEGQGSTFYFSWPKDVVSSQ